MKEDRDAGKWCRCRVCSCDKVAHSVQLGSRSVCEFVARGQNRTCDTGLSEIIAKFHYTDTDTDPNGPARTQRSFAANKVRVRVRVVEFSYNS